MFLRRTSGQGARTCVIRYLQCSDSRSPPTVSRLTFGGAGHWRCGLLGGNFAAVRRGGRGRNRRFSAPSPTKCPRPISDPRRRRAGTGAGQIHARSARLSPLLSAPATRFVGIYPSRGNAEISRPGHGFIDLDRTFPDARAATTVVIDTIKALPPRAAPANIQSAADIEWKRPLRGMAKRFFEGVLRFPPVTLTNALLVLAVSYVQRAASRKT